MVGAKLNQLNQNYYTLITMLQLLLLLSYYYKHGFKTVYKRLNAYINILLYKIAENLPKRRRETRHYFIMYEQPLGLCTHCLKFHGPRAVNFSIIVTALETNGQLL